MQYSSQQSALLFNVSKTTINNWAKEFAEYLSADATPGSNKNRIFTPDDMAVLSLIAASKRSGKTYPDIHQALKRGERGVEPETSPQELQILSPAEKERRVSVVVEHLQQTLATLRQELAEAQQIAAQVHQAREENARMQAQVEFMREQQTRLEQEIAEYKKEVRDLSMQAGREYAKGFIEGFNNSRGENKED